MTNVIASETDLADHLAEGTVSGDDGDRTKRRSRRAILARRFFRNKTAVFGLAIYVFLVLFAIFGPLLTKWGYTDLDRGAYSLPPEGEWRFWQWPQTENQHWFGTDGRGGDIFAQTIEGLRKSMVISLLVALIAASLAAVIGSFAAYFGGVTEKLSLWVIDLLLIVPNFLIIAIIMSRQGGGSTGMPLLILMLGGLGWMLSARVVRSMTMTLRDREYVVAAKYMGVPGPVIVFRHILPNISSLIIIDATLAVAYAVLAETGLSFFNFGIQSPEVSLGTLIGGAQTAALTRPWLFWFPAIFLVLMVVAVNFIGDGLRDAFDPSSKSGGKA